MINRGNGSICVDRGKVENRSIQIKNNVAMAYSN